MSSTDILTREELIALTGFKQAARAVAWLHQRGWVYEPPARRGDWPKVLRSYRDERMSGRSPDKQRPRLRLGHFGIPA